jgi:hypothetical protein
MSELVVDARILVYLVSEVIGPAAELPELDQRLRISKDDSTVTTYV